MVQVLVQSVHQVAAHDDRVVVHDVELCDTVLVVIFEHIAVGLHHAKTFYHLPHRRHLLAELTGHLVVEVLLLVVYPRLNDTTGYFVLVVIERHHVAAFLRHSDVNVAHQRRFVT